MGLLTVESPGVKCFSRFFLLIGLVSVEAFSQTINVTAKYAPNPTSLNDNKFVNTTPVSGYCKQYPDQCKENETFSIAFGSGTNKVSLSASHSDPRQGAMFNIPSSWREVSVENSSGDVQLLKLRISGFGGTYRVGSGISHDAAWRSNNGSSWVYAPLPCRYGGVGAGDKSYFIFFWKTPNTGVCAKQAIINIPSFTIDGFNFAYEMISPDPLAMSAGNYTGRMVYTLGPGQDFDFGDKLIPNDPILELNFTLTVNHIFKVQFPPGADRLSLIPDGGWQQWLHRGRRPEKLFANQPFQIWSSGRFNMQLQCQYAVDEQCGIRNESGHLVPVETRVTLPAGITALSGMAVNRQLLSNTNAITFLPSLYVDNGRASLHFEVGRDSVKDMTNYAGSHYSGNVTVVWDSQVDG